MRNEKIKDFVFSSIIVSIIVVLTATMWGFIPLGGFAYITIIHIPVLIGAIILGKKYGLIFGTVFGISSLVLSLILLGGNAPFTNPLLSVVPRAFFGFIIYPLYALFSRQIKSHPLAISVTIVVSTLLHSIIVGAGLYFIGKAGFYFTASENPWTTNDNFFVFFLSLFSLNSLIEIVLAVLIGTPTVMVLEKLRNNAQD